MKPLAAREISLEGQPGAFAGSLMNSSADLVMRACQGDEEAFRLIFERYSRPVISFILKTKGARPAFLRFNQMRERSRRLT